ncbi:hypothetical protein PGB28_13855 [Primorskyibacter aestuariivivens]|uniref:hypothetical protein n=1 Tax=Primorskyibacter aestuariivivens TaxID=1888912 RepID=UPI002300081D|nr:hypothetical protein [Primorskyibacter aestuariivivens]MDA7429549.1 hypothetical protein [Primorskyibacter aestuariivivens]
MAVLMVWIAAAAKADVALDRVDACLAERMAAGQPAMPCVDEAHAACMNVDNETPAVATLCFVEAGKAWNNGIAGTMARIATKAPDEITAIARIEVKYDLLSALLQCSRLEELALSVGRDSEEKILRQNARCKENATGLTYARLFLRSQDLR